jgi:hypothetical protein
MGYDMTFTAAQVADTIEAAGYRRPTVTEATAAAAWLIEAEITHPADIKLAAALLPVPADAAGAIGAYSWATLPRIPGMKADAAWPPAWTFDHFGRASAAAGALTEAA